MRADGALVLIGATASGKTALLERLFGPEGRFAGAAEVISADSMQAYRGMDIGTAKPEAALRAALPHHLIDIRNPDEQFTAGDFVRLASEARDDIAARGLLPVVAGGTGFYLRNLLLGMPSAPAADPAMREAVALDLERLGAAALRAELERGDPVSAARIHRNDVYRLTRALEILRATGQPLAAFLPGGGEGSGPRLVVHYLRPKAEIAERARARVEAMFSAGLAAEVARLRDAGFRKDNPGMKAIGYSEFFELEASGLAGAALLGALKERVTTDTVKYAKRQETYFRGLCRDLRRAAEGGSPFRVEEMEAESPESDADRLAEIVSPLVEALRA